MQLRAIPIHVFHVIVITVFAVLAVFKARNVLKRIVRNTSCFSKILQIETNASCKQIPRTFLQVIKINGTGVPGRLGLTNRLAIWLARAAISWKLNWKAYTDPHHPLARPARQMNNFSYANTPTRITNKITSRIFFTLTSRIGKGCYF